MAEAGVDISGQHSELIFTQPLDDIDLVVTVCGHAAEHCPVFPGRSRVIHHGFDDPPALARDARTEEEALAPYRRVRDEIRAYVQQQLPVLLADTLKPGKPTS
jgi:arsenate reductase